MCPKQRKNQTTAGGSDGVAGPLRYNSQRLQTELTSLADILGRKWTLVIIHRLLRDGPMGFSDLLDEIDGISSKVLSENLDRLDKGGFIERNIISERPFRVEYSVTESGQMLESVISEVRAGNLRIDNTSDS